MNGGSLESARWRVSFFRLGDRVAHAIFSREAGGEVELYRSLEGTDADDWPPSPPLKELSFEQRPGGVQLALLVGMAGASHWSLSVELDPATERLTFDAACRLSGVPRWLGSTYELCYGAPAEQRRSFEAAAGAEARLDAVQRRLEIAAELSSGATAAGRRTQVWKYLLSAIAPQT